MTNLMYPSSQGAKWCQALAFYFNRIKMEFIQLDYCLWVLQNMSKHIQCLIILFNTLMTIKKLSCSTYIQNPQKTPFYTLVPLQLSPCPKLCTIMYVVCTKLNYASDWSWWRRWRVWSIYQMRQSQNSPKKPSMACLINLLNDGVNGVDGFDGVNGVFDNLP